MFPEDVADAGADAMHAGCWRTHPYAAHVSQHVWYSQKKVSLSEVVWSAIEVSFESREPAKVFGVAWCSFPGFGFHCRSLEIRSRCDPVTPGKGTFKMEKRDMISARTVISNKAGSVYS